MIMKRLCILFVLICFILPVEAQADSRHGMPEPSCVPAELKGILPHTPSVSIYYFGKLLLDGKMKLSDVMQSQRYMIFRYARRTDDLRTVAHMNKDQRHNYMAMQKKLRGNPLKEYADYCHLTYECARDLMDILHASNKGTLYYNQLKSEHI